MNRVSLIQDYLDEMFPNPKCELTYNKDYELLIAVVLSAQTTDKRVNSVTSILFDKYHTLEELSEANINDIEIIIKPIGTYVKKAMFIKNIATILVNNYNSQVPNDKCILESLPGVGRKTTNVVLGELFNVPAIAVDTHVSRVSQRLKLSLSSDVSIIEKKLMKAFPKEEWYKRHKQLVLFGRYHCKAINPNCECCHLKDICTYKKDK